MFSFNGKNREQGSKEYPVSNSCRLPGIEYGKNELKMGWKNQPTRLVSLTDVKVHKKNLIGEEGNGFKIAMQGLDGGRINIATCSIGTMEAAMEGVQRYMNERSSSERKFLSFKPCSSNCNMVTELSLQEI